MAGITDLPFRELCRDMGAALAVSEMVNSNPACRNTRKSLLRLDHGAERRPRAVQIVGADPAAMADAAAFNADRGADIIDINMGCPAKKVCKKAAGSALLRDESLVAAILQAVIGAVSIPVTLKIRTGWDKQHINALAIGRLAQDCGIQALSVHGRTRACGFLGQAEYDTIATVVDNLDIPVLANGDITRPDQALAVLRHTGAAGIMIGRGAQGNPWIFSAVDQLLATGQAPPAPGHAEVLSVMEQHLLAIHAFYGAALGTRLARKHIGWYLRLLKAESFASHFNGLGDPQQQREALGMLKQNLNTGGEIAA